MQHALQRTWTPQQRWHIGDLAWGRNSIPGQEQDWRTVLWVGQRHRNGLGLGELPGHLDLHVDPADPELADDVLAWFETMAAEFRTLLSPRWRPKASHPGAGTRRAIVQ